MDAGALINAGGEVIVGVMFAVLTLPLVGDNPLVTSGRRPSSGKVPAREGRGGGADPEAELPDTPAVMPFIAVAAFPYPAEYLFGFGEALADPPPCPPTLPFRLGELDIICPVVESRRPLIKG